MPSRPKPAAPQVHPVHTLRELVTALEAAITLALADPKTKPVHTIRTVTRRIEAQLTLIDLLPSIPDHAKPARKCRKLLKKLRRAAGAVRDLDVQQDLVAEAVPRKPAGKQSRAIKDEAKVLHKALKSERKHEAQLLVRTIHNLQTSLAPTLEDLLTTLAPAAKTSLSPAELSNLTLDWYQHHTPTLQESTSSTPDPDNLHSIRKSAKLARYIAESGDGKPPSTTPSTTKNHKSTTNSPHATTSNPAVLAAEFEALQQSGGTWHDFLTLSEVAHKYLGKKALLTHHFEQSRDQALTQYREHLQHPPT